MMRKSLFWGLTVMLVAVLVWLVMQSRREEAQRRSGPVEIVKTARLSPTRVIAPKDLEVTGSPIEMAAERSKGVGRSQRGAVMIRNRGEIAYHNIMLKLDCFGSSGKTLHMQTRVIVGTLQPGQSLQVGDIPTEGLPPGTVRCTVTILHADLGPATPQ